jgi:chromosome partitioning protein
MEVILGKIIAVANQKGGVGKTTTTVNISAIIAKKGKKVLIIDMDPQGNATSGLGISKDTEKSAYEVLVTDMDIKDTIIDTKIKNLKICPSTIQLAGAEVELVNRENREKQLKAKLEGIVDMFDYIIMDCPPSLGLITLNAFTAADSVLIPVQCEYYALEGLGQLMSTINLVRKLLNPSLAIEGAVLTMFDPRTNLSIQVVEEVRSYFKDNVFESVIPRNIKLSEAPSYGMTIFEYDIHSKGAKYYEKLSREILKKNEHRRGFFAKLSKI